MIAYFVTGALIFAIGVLFGWAIAISAFQKIIGADVPEN